MTHAITRLSPDEFHDSVKGLADLLTDVVAGGASLGFLASLDQDEAAGWWSAQEPAVADGSLIVWAGRSPDGVDGTISLALERKANGLHRAEVAKLMVHRRARGQRLGRALLATAEQAAAEAGRTLLLLDTETASAAEHLYRSAGWTRYGIVPGYASDPHGALRDSTFFYKTLG
jgi:ribosomal protein S18 acetylase RimI-like enzyme